MRETEETPLLNTQESIQEIQEEGKRAPDRKPMPTDSDESIPTLEAACSIWNNSRFIVLRTAIQPIINMLNIALMSKTSEAH